MLFDDELLIDDLVKDKEIIGVIYITENLVNNKVYVGQQTIQGKSLKGIKKYLGSGTTLQKALKKYGRRSFQKHYVDIAFDKKTLNSKEIDWIAKVNARDRAIGYNIQLGGFRKDLENTSIMWVTNGLENLQIGKDQFEAYKARGYWHGTNLRGQVCFVNDGASERRVYKTDLDGYLSKGFTLGRILGKEYVEKVWAHYQNRMPSRMGKDNMPKEFSVIPDCPICHAPNSPDNFCCCEEHWDQFERERLERMSAERSAFVASTWEDESVVAARKENISKAFTKRRALQAVGELDKYLWVSNGETNHELQAPESSVPEWLSKGYSLGRLGFSEEARANMGREAGFKWSEESIAKREETRAVRHAERMKDPEYAAAWFAKKKETSMKCAGKKSETWAKKELSEEWRAERAAATKAGYAAKKAERVANGECVQKKWVHRGQESMRVLATEFDARVAEGWEPGRGKQGSYKKHGATRVWVNRDGESKRVTETEKDHLLMDGWKLGRGKVDKG